MRRSGIAAAGFFVAGLLTFQAGAASSTGASSPVPPIPGRPVPSRQFQPHVDIRWPEQLANADIPTDRSLLVVATGLPAVQLDYSSGSRLKRSVISQRDQIESFEPGHVMLAWQCRSAGTTSRDQHNRAASAAASTLERGMTAHTGELDRQSLTLLQQGWGLTPLITNYRDGFLESVHRLESRTLPAFLDHGRLRAFVLDVSDEDCRRVRNFVFAFARNPRAQRIFGLSPIPVRYEGAGCGSFVAAALSSAGLFYDIPTHGLRTLRLPRYLFGCPNNVAMPLSVEAPCVAPGHVVRMSDLWAWPWEAEEDTIRVEFYDPALVAEYFASRGRELRLSGP